MTESSNRLLCPYRISVGTIGYYYVFLVQVTRLVEAKGANSQFQWEQSNSFMAHKP